MERGNQSQPTAADFVFGYGSIFNDESRRGTIGAESGAVFARLSPDLNLVRAWNFLSPTGFAALGLEDARASSTSGSNDVVPGVVVAVRGSLAAFDAREKGYSRRQLHQDDVTLEWDKVCGPSADLDSLRSWAEGDDGAARMWVYWAANKRFEVLKFK